MRPLTSWNLSTLDSSSLGVCMYSPSISSIGAVLYQVVYAVPGGLQVELEAYGLTILEGLVGTGLTPGCAYGSWRDGEGVAVPLEGSEFFG